MGESGETIHVASAADLAYLPHAAATFHSVTEHASAPLHLHLLTSRGVLPPEAVKTLTRWAAGLGAEATVHEVDDAAIDGVPAMYSIATWYRVLLPELLPQADRVLYLDGDTIVTDSLDSLFQIDLSDHLTAAVTNLPLNAEWIARRCAALGIPGADDYFNAGVQLMNLDRLRHGDWTQRILDYGREHADPHRDAEVDEDDPRSVFVYTVSHPERLLFPDQDAACAILYPHRLKLQPRWNSQLVFRRFEERTAELTDEAIAEAIANPAIRHFEGPGQSKPWHPRSDPADQELYWAHRSRTPWPE